MPPDVLLVDTVVDNINFPPPEYPLPGLSSIFAPFRRLIPGDIVVLCKFAILETPAEISMSPDELLLLAPNISTFPLLNACLDIKLTVPLCDTLLEPVEMIMFPPVLAALLPDINCTELSY